MRTLETSIATTSMSSRMPGSPPRASVWSTERRIAEKGPPGAPKKPPRNNNNNYQPYSYTTSSCLEHPSPSSRKRSHDRLLLPSSTIDEEEDSNPTVSLSFRPTRLFCSSTADPTTVILAPEDGESSWFLDDDDVAISPRLLRFGPVKLARSSCCVLAADDASDTIFRPREEDDDDDDAQDRCPLSMRSQDDTGDRDD